MMSGLVLKARFRVERSGDEDVDRLFAHHLSKMAMERFRTVAERVRMEQGIDVTPSLPTFADSSQPRLLTEIEGMTVDRADTLATDEERNIARRIMAPGRDSLRAKVADVVKHRIEDEFVREIDLDELYDRAKAATNESLPVRDDDGRVRMPADLDEILAGNEAGASLGNVQASLRRSPGGDEAVPSAANGRGRSGGAPSVLDGSEADGATLEELRRMQVDDGPLPNHRAPATPFHAADSKEQDARVEILARSLLGADASDLMAVSLVSLLLCMHDDGLTLQDVAAAIRAQHPLLPPMEALRARPASDISWVVTAVRPLEGYRLWVRFVDGLEGTVDMAARIRSPRAGVFARLADPEAFAQVFLLHNSVAWPGEIDLAPDAMYDAIKARGEWILE